MKHDIRKFRLEALNLQVELWIWGTREDRKFNNKEREIFEQAVAALTAAKEHLINLEEVINLR